jgi:LPXTG-motif cell wall-anchored protein
LGRIKSKGNYLNKRILFFHLSIIFSFMFGCTDSNILILPTISPNTDWQNILTDEVEIYFPQEYLVLTELEKDEIITKLEEYGPEYIEFIDSMKSGYSSIELIAIQRADTIALPTLYTNIIIIRETVPIDIALEEFVYSYLRNLPNNIHLEKRELIMINQLQSVKLTLNAFYNGEDVAKQIHYIIKKGNDIWHIVCTTPKTVIDKNEIYFDQIAGSIKITQISNMINLPSTSSISEITALIGFAIMVISIIFYSILKRRKKRSIN